MGRNIGQTEVTVDEMKEIVHLTLSSTLSRRQIAEKVGRSTNTVWQYQKKYDIL
jgi:transposase